MNTDAIRDEMKKRGMCQNELARQIDVSEGTVSNILNGKRDARVKTFKRMCEVLNVKPEEVW